MSAQWLTTRSDVEIHEDDFDDYTAADVLLARCAARSIRYIDVALNWELARSELSEVELAALPPDCGVDAPILKCTTYSLAVFPGRGVALIAAYDGDASTPRRSFDSWLAEIEACWGWLLEHVEEQLGAPWTALPLKKVIVAPHVERSPDDAPLPFFCAEDVADLTDRLRAVFDRDADPSDLDALLEAICGEGHVLTDTDAQALCGYFTIPRRMLS